MITCLLFDLDNTLYSCRWGLEEGVRRRMQEFSAAFLGVSPEEAWRQRMTGGGRYGTNLEWLMEEKGFTDVESYLAAVHPRDEADCLPPDPALRAFLADIPLPKAILTNSPREHTDLILRRLGVTDMFTRVFDIRENNFKGKPRREAFTYALDALGTAAEAALFVDDAPRYVGGFIGLGGRGLLLDETDAHPHFPYPKIRSLEELTRFL
jgi:putative hydrolase of the HAD superfamily